MKWVTRRGVRLDRTACAWLIKRHIDPHAEIVYVDSNEIASGEWPENAAGLTPNRVGARTKRLKPQDHRKRITRVEPNGRCQLPIAKTYSLTATSRTCPARGCKKGKELCQIIASKLRLAI